MHRNRKLLLATFSVGALALASTSLAWACTTNSDIALAAGGGPPGASVNVQGYDFVSGEVDLYWDSVSQGNLLVSVAATGSGSSAGTSPGGSSFSTQVTIPDDAIAAEHTIIARSSPDNSGRRYSASKSFDVTPAPSTDPAPDPAPADGGGSQDTSGDTGGSQDTSGDTGGSQVPTGDTGGSQVPTGDTGGSQAPTGDTSKDTSGTTTRSTSGQSAQSRNSSGSAAPVVPEGPSNSGTTTKPSQDEVTPPAPANDQPAQQPADDTTGNAGQAPRNDAPVADSGSSQQDNTSGNGSNAGSTRTSDSTTPTSSNTAPVVTTNSGESVFGGSVGTSDNAAPNQAGTDTSTTDTTSAPGSLTPQRPVTGQVPAQQGQADPPSTGSAAGDLWSGFQSQDNSSLTSALTNGPDVGTGQADDGGLLVGAGLLGGGLLLLLAGGGAAARKRRRATATARR